MAAGNVTPKDMQNLSDAVLNGYMEMNNLPDYAQAALANYWEQSGVSLSGDDTSQAQMEELIRSREVNAPSFFDSPVFKPIEWVGSKLYWLYSNSVSPLVSSAALSARTMVYGRPDYIGEDGELDALKDYWNLTRNKISPGQAIWMIGMNDKELKQRGISPDQISEDMELVNKGEYKDAPTASDPFGVKTRAQEYFGEGTQKWVTGSTDLALSWYVDPLVLIGKGASAAKAAGVTRNVSTQIEKSVKDLTKRGVALPDAQMQAWDQFASKRPFQGMVDSIMNIKQTNPDTAAAVLTRDFATLRKSANGPAVARLLAQAKDADEVVSIMRVTMGDHAGALNLEAKSTLLADQIGALTAKNSSATAYYDALPDMVKMSPRGQRIKAAIDQQTKNVAKMNADNRIIDDKLAAYNLIGDMNYNRLTSPVGMKIRGAELQPVKGQGLIKGTTNLIYNTSIGVPVKLAHTYHGIKPSYYIDTRAENGWRDVEAALSEVRGLSKEGRDKYVSQYIAAAPEGKALELTKIEQAITHRIIDRYNLKNPNDQLDYTLADDLYKEFAQRRHAAQASSANRRSYGNATAQLDPADATSVIRVAEIMSDGSRLVPSPILESQLASNHVLMDFGLFEKVVNANGSAWKKAKMSMGDKWIQTSEVLDTLGSVWKFAQLFRLGYGPRALADDVLGQVARFGMFDMMARTIKGGRVTAEDWHNQRWLMDRTENARMTAAMLDTHLGDLTNMQKKLKADLVRAKAGKGGDPVLLQQNLDDVAEQLQAAQKTRADMDSMTAAGQQMRHVQVGREVFAPAFGGTQGALFRDLASGQRNFANMMGSQADWYLKRMRTRQWEDVSPATAGPEKHFEAWRRVINQQFANDRLAREVMMGRDHARLVRWINSTPEGQAYRLNSPLKNVSVDEMVLRVKAEVDYVLDPAMPGIDAVRAAAIRGEQITDDMLSAVPINARPLVNAERFEYARGTHPVAEAMDRAMTGYFELVNQMPARKLLRNPLFGQQYKANLADSLRKLRAQGVTHIDESMRTRLESAARQNALRDVKRYTFTMDHETKMAYMMRHFGAFFGAQQESWNRWARIISDKPQVLPHVAQVYGAPARAGIVVDQDGNTVDATGYMTDPATGERKLVDYSDRKMLIQIPDYLGGKELNKFLGLDEDATFTVPMSSIELILNHGDGPIPVGAGPYVQLAANDLPGTEYDASGTPELADFYRKLGILPMGPKESAWDFINSNTGQRLGDAGNDFSETKQRSMFYMMQVENYKWEAGLRDSKPTWKELENRASKWAWFRTGIAFGLPFSVNAQDPYQFFRDEYQRFQKLDANSADQKFYDKYGDSFYSFSQSMSKNNMGLRPTAESVQMSKYYQDLIAEAGPEYAGLIVGDEGEGKFSEGAYFYQKTHTTDPASLTPQRSQLGAREAWEQSQVSRGWAFYNAQMNGVNAQLFDRGLTTFDDEGAEDLKETRKAILNVLTQPYFPDGTGNPYYNKEWEQKFSSLDKGKYDRTAMDLERIVTDPELWSKAVNPDGSIGMRSDIYTLKSYLEKRKNMQAALILRDQAGGSKDITAETNYDLKNSWDTYVMGLIESDTKFAWVHNRFFATDMGFNVDARISPERQRELAEADETVVGETATEDGEMPTMFDIMQTGGEFIG